MSLITFFIWSRSCPLPNAKAGRPVAVYLGASFQTQVCHLVVAENLIESKVYETR